LLAFGPDGIMKASMPSADRAVVNFFDDEISKPQSGVEAIKGYPMGTCGGPSTVTWCVTGVSTTGMRGRGKLGHNLGK